MDPYSRFFELKLGGIFLVIPCLNEQRLNFYGFVVAFDCFLVSSLFIKDITLDIECQCVLGVQADGPLAALHAGIVIASEVEDVCFG